MGLAVEVSALVYLLEEDEEAAEFVQADFDNLNAILEQNNLPPHREPTSLPELQSRAGVTSFPYTGLHYLRRFYARFLDDPNWLSGSLHQCLTLKIRMMSRY